MSSSHSRFSPMKRKRRKLRKENKVKLTPKKAIDALAVRCYGEDITIKSHQIARTKELPEVEHLEL
jgi:hypothetical protein